MKILSISIAAYNAEKWLETCLNSFVIPKILEDIEVLIINDGDFAGIAALQGLYGAVAVTKTEGRYELVMFEKNPDTADSSSDDEIERERIQLNSPVVKLKCVTDYTDGKDEAKFYYEKDNKWIMAGSPKKLFFRLDHFTGCRFALFYYSTKQMGGYSDFMNFEINCIHK